MEDLVAQTGNLSVFVSYAKQDEDIADYVQLFLNRAGYRTATFTTSITPGDRWISSINQSLEYADVVVILISKSTLESPWVLYEISASIASAESGSGKQVIPVALGKDISPSGVLAQYQWIITSGDPHEVATMIIRALKEPHRADKALEREEAWRGIGLAQTIFDEEVRHWTAMNTKRDKRFASLLLYFSILSALVLAATAIYLAVSGKTSSFFIAITVGVTSVIAGTFGYVSGRSSRGVRDDRPHK